MGELYVTVRGVELPFAQVLAMGRAIEEIRARGETGVHWHQNECRCCVTVHGSGGSYLIGSQGGTDYFPGETCGCYEHDGGGDAA